MDKNLEMISTWSKSKQVNTIEKIVSKFPTAKDFKDQILSSDNESAKAIVQQLPDDADRSTYIDFLQHCFIKHSKIGKVLLSSLVGIGIGAGLAYLGHKEGDKYAKNVI